MPKRTFSSGLFLLTIFCLLVPANVFAQQRPKKKIVEYGWDVPYPEFVRDNIREMTEGVCPYSVLGECTVHFFRFAACRIFFCDGDITEDQQSEISEKAIERFKDICRRYDIQYSYCEIGIALGNPEIDL